MIEDAMQVLAGETGRVAVIGLHPWLFGMPHRIRYLDDGLRRVGQIDGVWSTTVGQIAAHFRSQWPLEDQF